MRIVSLSPAMSELLFEIGAGDRVIAVDQFSERPKSLQDAKASGKVQVVGTSLSPMVEKILSLSPDLVLSEKTTGSSALDVLRDEGIAIQEFRYESLDQMMGTWRSVGKIVGEEKAVDGLISEVLTLATNPAPEASPKVLLLYKTDDLAKLSAVGPTSYQSDILERLGAANVVAGTSQSNVHLSLEKVIELDPDLIIELALEKEAEEAESPWPSHTGIRAIRDKELHILAGYEMYSVGPSMREFIRKLRQTLDGWRMRQRDR